MGKVSAEVRRKVIVAARAMGLRRQLPPSYRPLIRINLVLARAYLSLLEGIAADFRSLTKPMSRQSSLQLSALLDESPETIRAAIRAAQCNAVVAHAQDSTLIRDAIAELQARGIPLITIISDLPVSKRLAYAGTDHRADGRTAGFFWPV